MVSKSVQGLRAWLEAPVADAKMAGRTRLDALRGAAARITTPLLPDDYLHLVNPLWSARELRGRIIEVRKETADSVTLVIKPGWGFDFTFTPGQYIGIGVLVEGRWHWRSYSLTCPPDWTHRDNRAERVISIAVKAMPEGFLSSHLVNGVPQGTVVRLAAPQGGFVLPEPPPAKVLFITAGSGITPVMAMLRTMDRRAADRTDGDAMDDIVHIHSARTAEDVMFGAELRALHDKHPGFTAHIHLTGEQGKFDLADLDSRFPDWRERETWACGPAGLLNDVEKHWAAAGISDKLHVERFEVERSAVGEGGTVTFARTDRSAEADGATSLLEAGEAAGVQMPFGCRMGICQTCVVTLTDGHVRDLRNGAEHQAGEKIQTCISAAAGDCTLDV
ncbi:stearoyl-CoA 9-desaturase [Nocardia sp. 852002-20019_SCH5090214]|uniref:Ferredoxin reductase n=1 Tax=Nocardia nova TaxID=37330 RepID=A0A2S6A1X1_9NOCA|nr:MULTISPECIES: ferredoxin reductase [Nocardia]OBF84942.1 stearoyl-CoA 9-desaturase [Mycobacterium sp. 852002-51759_SCH5129042]MBF6275570.1 ferredoxin reductase [Nocardia nova]MBV7704723.1 ferredoxin reductase [Nocardia nova]OBA42145.1 stearoyl-CoA 9-desaturase [Nocardia sp. 852002-20019_SCH5090214]OBA56362.1 stearoyl-CoA 9-desaturase [Nocardia sp. 852002-51101_SCH5132738]